MKGVKKNIEKLINEDLEQVLIKKWGDSNATIGRKGNMQLNGVEGKEIQKIS